MFTGAETKRAEGHENEIELNLLVEWEPRWQGFVTSVRPALQRSPRRLAGEIDTRQITGRPTMASAVVHAAAIGAVMLLTLHTEWMKPTVQLADPQISISKYQVLYYSTDELPQTRDVGGAEAGLEGRSGGREAHSAKQVIRVARGDKMAEQVADAPKLKLPLSAEAVANMLALERGIDAGPVPAAAIRSNRILKPQTDAVEPAPDVDQAVLRALRSPSTEAVAPSVDVREIEARLHQFKLQRDAVQAAADVSGLRTNSKLPQLPAQVVPPPVSAPVDSSARLAKLRLPPPAVAEPAVDASAVPGPRNSGARTIGANRNAVAPSVDAGEIGGASGRGSSMGKLASGATGVASPADGNGSGTGAGTTTAAGHGTPNGNGGVTGVIVSATPGSRVGMPGDGGGGSIAMSPNGSGNVGLGGTGAGLGIGSGSGTGSGTKGVGPGAATAGTGHGSSPDAHGGISPGPGPGGSGSGSGPGAGGVTVSGGTSVVNIPSFGGSADPANVIGPGSDHGPRKQPAVTIVATSRSGGAMNRYGALQGRVYTIYFDTALGTAVMEYADREASVGFNADLTAPEPTRTDLPAGLPRAKTIISCTIDRSGTLRDVQLLETKGGASVAQLIAAIQNWRFRPVLRAGNAVEVNAILGFYIDTR